MAAAAWLDVALAAVKAVVVDVRGKEREAKFAAQVARKDPLGSCDGQLGVFVQPFQSKPLSRRCRSKLL